MSTFLGPKRLRSCDEHKTTQENHEKGQEVKVVQVFGNDLALGAGIASGAGIAMARLHAGLRTAGVDSHLLCERKTTNSAHVSTIRPLHWAERQLRRVTSRLGLNDIHRLSSFSIKRHPTYLNADIVHFHATHGGFINYLALPSLTRHKRALFTLHDMWLMTGHCAISYDCDRWKFGCGKCPYPDSYPAIRRDATKIEWKLKKWVYGRTNLSIVSLSNWQTEQIKASMLNRFPVHHIPNGIDTAVYKPLDREQCRSVLGIPLGKRVLMFAAPRLDAHWKGGDLLLESLRSLPMSLKERTVLLLLGDKGDAIAHSGIQTLKMGHISNDRLKAALFSASDLFVHPTRADMFPLVLQESMACGTPMVSFRVGGVPDLVRPGITGYLAEPGNTSDFRNGIIQLLEDDSLHSHMSRQCRAIALKEYTVELQVQRYIALYKRLLQNDT